ncbi:MAG: DUF1489 domain-containing protein [Pseudomonadota bacterium]|nr:DUF1489 domain-containing protein [Pseudomonadota bacterium]
MPVHIIKLAVGIESLSHFRQRQLERITEEPGGTENARLIHLTRNAPRRKSEILEGGSIYWVIRGFITARQRITAVDTAPNYERKPCCALVLDPDLVPVLPQPYRAFQGWRYLETTDAPKDVLGQAEGGYNLPPELANELRRLGLL